MRLLITTDSVGGVWDYTATLTAELERRGHSILLAVLGQPTTEQLGQLPEGIAVDCRPYRLEWMPGAERDLQPAAEWIERLAASWGAGVVHLNQMAYTGLVSFTLPTVVVVHSDVCSWFGEVTGSAPDSTWDGYRAWVRQGLRRATLVGAPTRYQAELTTRHYGRVVDRVIHNARPDPGDALRPKERGLLMVGRAWDPAKGTKVLDEALELLGDAAPPAVLLGSLDGPAGERYRPLRLKAPGHLPADELRDQMARAAIYVGASLYEPFGLAPLEAAMQECALVLSDIGSFRELWDGCAEFVPRNDPAALARAISGLDADRGRATKLGRVARLRALQRYIPERLGDEYASVYAALGELRSKGSRMAAPALFPTPR